MSNEEGFIAVLAALKDIRDGLQENNERVKRLETVVIEHIKSEEDRHERLWAMLSQHGSRLKSLEGRLVPETA